MRLRLSMKKTENRLFFFLVESELAHRKTYLYLYHSYKSRGFVPRKRHLYKRHMFANLTWLSPAHELWTLWQLSRHVWHRCHLEDWQWYYHIQVLNSAILTEPEHLSSQFIYLTQTQEVREQKKNVLVTYLPSVFFS